MPFSKDHPNLVCGICGSEVVQVGGFMKCQNVECKMEIPLDLGELRDAASINILERDSQTPDL